MTALDNQSDREDQENEKQSPIANTCGADDLSVVGIRGCRSKQTREGKSFPPGPCRQRTKVCVQSINKQISLIRAYVQRLKPETK